MPTTIPSTLHVLPLTRMLVSMVMFVKYVVYILYTFLLMLICISCGCKYEPSSFLSPSPPSPPSFSVPHPPHLNSSSYPHDRCSVYHQPSNQIISQVQLKRMSQMNRIQRSPDLFPFWAMQPKREEGRQEDLTNTR